MTTRRSRLKILPNVGGRGNKDSSSITGEGTEKKSETKSDASSGPKEHPKAQECASATTLENGTTHKTQAGPTTTTTLSETKQPLNTHAVTVFATPVGVTQNIPPKFNSVPDEKAFEEFKTCGETNSSVVGNSVKRLRERESLEGSNYRLHSLSLAAHDSISEISKEKDSSITLASTNTDKNKEQPRTRTRLPKARPNVSGTRKSASNHVVSVEGGLEPQPSSSPPPIQRVVSMDTEKLPVKLVEKKKLLLEIPKLPVASSLNRAGNEEVDNTLRPSEVSNCAQRTTIPVPKATLTVVATKAITDVSGAALAPKTTQAPVSNKQPERSAAAVSSKTITTSSISRQAERKQKTKGTDEAAQKRRQNKKREKPPERSKMTMQDLIYWNPESNPMRYEDSTENIDEVVLANEEEEQTLLAEENSVEDELPDDVPEDEEADAMPVPQVRIGPDGNIIVDERSLVIETTASKKSLEGSPLVYEKSSDTTYSSYKKKKRARTWTGKETKKFYKVLSSVGTDFSMMANFFPDRSRYELKLKFNREDRLHRDLVNKAIAEQHNFDVSLLEEDDSQLSETESQLSTPRVKDQENMLKKGRKAERGRSKHQPERKKGRRKKRSSSTEETTDDDDDEAKLNETVTILQDYPESSPAINSLMFDLDNPCNMHSTENDQLQTEGVIKSATEGDGEEVDDEMEVLLSTPLPTRAGRQPKRPQLFTVSNDENKPKKLRKEKPPAMETSSCLEQQNPNTNADLQNAILNVTSLLRNSPQTTMGNQNRLVFVPTPSPDNNQQVIHVYMLSPAATGSGTPRLTRPVQSPTSSIPPGGASPIAGTLGSPIVISPFAYPSSVRTPQSRPPQVVRLGGKTFVPNLASSSNRSRHVSTTNRSPVTIISGQSALAKALSSPPLTATSPLVNTRPNLQQSKTISMPSSSTNTQTKRPTMTVVIPTKSLPSTIVSKTSTTVSVIKTNPKVQLISPGSLTAVNPSTSADPS